jgi:hypothetical protein
MQSLSMKFIHEKWYKWEIQSKFRVVLDTCFEPPNILNTLRIEQFGIDISEFTDKTYSLTKLYIHTPGISASAQTSMAECLPGLHFLELGLPNQNIQLGEMDLDCLDLPHTCIDIRTNRGWQKLQFLHTRGSHAWNKLKKGRTIVVFGVDFPPK